MGIHDDELEGGLFEAFHAATPPPPRESVLGAIERLHGATSNVVLRDNN